MVRIYLTFLFVFYLGALCAQEVELYDRFEITLVQKVTGNPFLDVQLAATFQQGDTSFTVSGFYDGNDVFKIRFMPQKTGRWTYITKSNISELNKQTGMFDCLPSDSNNHGMVQVSDVNHFQHQDGTPYFPFGTTCYAWTHMDENLQNLTIKSLDTADFNKVRMCIMPKSYSYINIDPTHFPFERNTSTSSDEQWDFERFNPDFFRRLEARIDQLDKIGVQADLILFHPYDKGKWGFDSMPREIDVRYLQYVISRLSSFKNVWWSLANEWDFMKSKSVEDWNYLIDTVVALDPYGHLCSIHGSTASYFEYWKPELTHVSLQDEGPVQNPTSANTLALVYKKPVIFDEVAYEGNLTRRWGRLSPQEMTRRVWNGVLGGTYVTHGETYNYPDSDQVVFWASGGELKGQSWQRIKFLQKLIKETSAPLFMSDISRDFLTSSAGKGCYFIYFGKDIVDEWFFNLPKKNGKLEKLRPNTKFQVEIIDTWAMTITKLKETFITGKERDYRLYDQEHKKIRLPAQPYLALRITEIE